MAKKIELLHTTYDESGNIESQEVVHPLTSPDCIIMENGKTLDEVMGDGIATPTLTHEGTSFKVGVGDSNIEVVNGDVAGMTLKGQSYQNILPKPTTLIMETDEKEFKINDKIDSNIIIDDNIAEIATVKGRTIVNAVQEESGSEYTVLGEDLSGQSIVTTNKPEGNIKGVTLQGQTLVNTIQEPCKDDYVVLGADDSIEISAETGGHSTIENTVQGGINSAVLEGQTLVNLAGWNNIKTLDFGSISNNVATINFEHYYASMTIKTENMIKQNTTYTFIIDSKVTKSEVDGHGNPPRQNGVIIHFTDGTFQTPMTSLQNVGERVLQKIVFTTENKEIERIHIRFFTASLTTLGVCQGEVYSVMLIEGDHTNEDIPYFEGMQSVKMPVLTTIGKNLFDVSNLPQESTVITPTLTGYILTAYSCGFNKCVSDVFPDLIVGKTYVVSFQASNLSTEAANNSIGFYNGKTQQLSYYRNNESFTLTNEMYYERVVILYGVPGELVEFSNVQIEEGTTATSYEPYKSNILTVNEDVELRGIGDVKDELNLSTGELTQRICEVVLDGSDDEEWVQEYYSDNNDTTNPTMKTKGHPAKSGNMADKVLCDTLSIGKNIYSGDTNLGVCFVKDSNGLYKNIRIRTQNILNGQTLDDFKAELKKNPITVQYVLLDESIKTVDLTVTDQDGNTIPHIQTQPTVTHITASSDYLIPTVTIDNNLAYDTIIKPSTLYTIRFKHNTVNADNPLTVDLGGTTQTVTSTEFTITTPSELTHNQLVFSGKNNVVSEVQVIEGDVTNIEYPFFEGMSDVKFSDSQFIGRGKNLLHVGKGYSTTSINGLTVIRNEVEQTITINGTCTLNNTSCPLAPFYREFKKGERYAFSCKLISGTADKILFRVNDQDWKANISCGFNATSSNIYETCIKTFNANETYDRSSIRVDNGATFNNAVFKVMLEKIPVLGDYTPQYEPYKGVVEVQQDVDSIPLTSDMFEQGKRERALGLSMQQCPLTSNSARISSKTLIPVKPNTKYVVQGITSANHIWGDMYDKDGLLCYDNVYGLVDEVIPHDVHYMVIQVKNADESAISPSDLDSMNLILQEVPQEIVLRGIGDVKDELDLTRGVYTQRIGVINDLSQITGAYFNSSYMVGNKCALLYNLKDDMPKLKRNPDTTTFLPMYASNFTDTSTMQLGSNNGAWTNTNQQQTQNICTISTVNMNYDICISIPNSLTGVTSVDNTVTTIAEKFNNYIKSLDNFEIHYILETPIIHKVNLTNTKVIPSYSTETHYETITPSGSLIPNITIPSTLNYNVAIKPSTEYTIRANTSDNLTVDLGGATGTLSNGKVTLTTPATLTHNEVKFSGTGKVKELMVVEGSEIKDNVPFFNGMKNVEMGGIKLVNIARLNKCSALVTANANKTQFTYTSNGETAYHAIYFDSSLLKTNTVYTVFADITTNTSDNVQPAKFQFGYASGNILDMTRGFVGKIKQTITSPNTTKDGLAIVFRPCSSGGKVVIENPMIIEGDWTHLDEIPFIESEMIIEQPIIRSQGKNLLDLESKYFNPSNVTYTKGGVTYTVTGNTSNYNYGQFAWTTADSWFRKLLGKEVTLSVSSISCTNANSKACIQVRMECTNGSKVFKTISINDSIKFITFTIPSNAIDMALQLMSNNTGSPLDSESTLTVSNIQLVLGNTVTTYKAYRHQTLYSNRVIGYEEGCYYSSSTGTRLKNNSYTSVLADVDGLEIAYVTGGSSNYTFFDKDGVFISGRSYPNTARTDNQNGFIIVPSNAKYMRFACGNGNDKYTPYTRATVTGELPLRSLPNGVCDTLNLVTGEYVQRVGEIIYQGGDEQWTLHTSSSNLTDCIHFMSPLNLTIAKNQVPYVTPIRGFNYLETAAGDSERVMIGGSEHIHVVILKSRLKTQDINGFKQYLSQNPITVQYELATPIVRKLGFTTKGNYREKVLDGSETWAMDVIDNSKTVRMIKKTVSPLQNPLYNTPLFTDDYYVRAGSESHNTYEYITCIGNTIYINIYQSKVKELSIQGCTQWLSQNPIKVGYITSAQSSESYSNIHKPIFFNNVDVQFLPQNIDIQPELTYQVRTRNSYVMDMMKANTKYSIKLFSSSGNMKIDGTSYTLANNRTFISPSTLTNKELIIIGQWYEPMIIEGDVTGKNLPYFKGILSSYHDVDEIEIHSVTNNIFDGKMELGIITSEGLQDEENAIRTVNYIKVKPSTIYYIGCDKNYRFATYYYDKNYKLIRTSGTNANDSVTIPSNCEYMKFRTSADLAQNDLTTKFWVSEKDEKVLLEYSPHAHNTTLIEMPTRLETVKVVRPVIENGAINTGNGASYDDGDALVKNVRTKDYLPVQPGEVIKFYNNGQGRAVNIHYYDINKQFIKYEFYDGVSTRPTVPKNCYFIRMYCGKSACSDITLTRQAYKPIQLNSLPNGVHDEIIMKPNSSKAQLVQRVGKVVLDGNAPYYKYDINSNAYCQWYTDLPNAFAAYVFSDTLPTFTERTGILGRGISGKGGTGYYVWFNIESAIATTESVIKAYLQQNPITVYYKLATPIIHEIQLKGYPHVYENGTVTLNTDIPHKTLVSYNVNQEQLISTQNETIIRHDQQIDDLYYYIEMYLEEIYQMELFRMKLELSL